MSSPAPVKTHSWVYDYPERPVRRRYVAYLLLLAIVLQSCNASKNTPVSGQPGPDVSVYMPRKMYDGYTLVAPFTSKNFYLVDKEGYAVKKWEAQGLPGAETAILPDGRILRAEKVNNPAFPTAGSTGGMIHVYNWDGSLNWEYPLSSDSILQHHDVKQLPNGNFLFTVWEKKRIAEVEARGKLWPLGEKPLSEMWFDKIIEVKQTGPRTGEVVWQWRLWDHLVQDFSSRTAGYAPVTASPGRVDINYDYLKQGSPHSFAHINGLEYIPGLDILVLSARNFHELWFIDHSTTTAEAATGTGGKRNKGGDLLYRWGNPFAYKKGRYEDRKLFAQHNPSYLGGLPGHGGNMLIYNNMQIDSNTVEFSSVSEIAIPFNNGYFVNLENGAALPADYSWTLRPQNFVSKNVSGAQRLPNGNTLTCTGAGGVFYEFTPAGELVWKYKTPIAPTSVFKAVRYPLKYPAFKNKILKKIAEVVR